MNKRQKMIGIAVAVGGAFLFTPGMIQNAVARQAKEKEMTKPMAKISPVAAMASAEGKVGGKAVVAIFEFDEGNWVYGVIVVKDHKLMEVTVDPNTGKALDSEAVTPEDEAKEFAAELKALQDK